MYCKNAVRKIPTDWLQRHWTQNKSGRCLLPLCSSSVTPGTLEHLLLFCPSLAMKRSNLLNLAVKVAAEHPALANILNHFLFKPPEPSATIQLLLDCTSIPEVIKSKDIYGPVIRDRLLHLGRTWCYSIHRDRMTQLGFLKFRLVSYFMTRPSKYLDLSPVFDLHSNITMLK